MATERDREIAFLLDKVKNFDKPMKILDVGFAGSWYIKDILEIDGVDYTGMDNDIDRITGKSFHVGQSKKDEWVKLLERITYISGDAITYKSEDKYDLVQSISVIEHIVPMGYSNNYFDGVADIKAVDAMKELSKNKLLLTFPCGTEKLFYNEKTNKNKKLLHDYGFEPSKHDLKVFNFDAIEKIIGDWGVIEERYWINTNNSFEETAKETAMCYTHVDSIARCICGLYLQG